MVEFSVIIPVYNAENRLKRCLDSLKEQSINNLEVIMIDDGSTDKSYEICKLYERNDRRFKLLSQENQGASAARNTGLDIATGKYIAFVDSDDFVSIDYLKCLRSRFIETNADIVFMGYFLLDNEERVVKTQIPPTSINKNTDICNLSQNDMFGYTWIKAFSADAIRNVRFQESMDLFEDEVFTCDVLKNCHIVATVDAPIYYYYVGNPDALTRKVHQDYCQMRDKVYNAWKEMLVGDADKDVVMRWQAQRAISTCKYYGFEQNIEPSEFFSSLAQTSFFDEYSGNSKFESYLRENKICPVLFMRMRYRLRLKVSKMKVGK